MFKKALVIFYLWLVSTPLIHARNLGEEAPTANSSPKLTMATTSPTWDSIFRVLLGSKMDTFVSILID